jgi:acetoin utilization deacetylase AcuC-like enzyme
MTSVYSPKHALHAGNIELDFTGTVSAYEMPSRAEHILARLKAVDLGPVLPPKSFGVAAAKRVHDSDYIDFLPTVYPKWLAAGRTGSALPYVWPARGQGRDRVPHTIDGQLGYYSFDACATLVAGTFEAVVSSLEVALTAAELVKEGASAAFALCRPPGHHAGSGSMGGYCFINNAAVTAQWFLDQGAKRVSILDIDYHHGNGTQEIFYHRSDVQFLSLHADTNIEYPYFLGHAEETGAGAGLGFNHNYPMPFGTTYEAWVKALEDACQKIEDYAPECLVVSLGVDTFQDDPISKFKLTTEDFPKIGARLRALHCPTLFVMEGGYAVEAIGVNVVGVLEGFDAPWQTR